MGSKGPRQAIRRVAALLTACCLLVCGLTGCVSTRVVCEASPDVDTSVSLSVYLETQHRRRGGPTVGGVVTELFYIDGDRRQLVRRELAGQWRQDGLVPGVYETEVRCRATGDGEWEDLSGDTLERFTLRPGEDADIAIVLEKTPVGVIVVAGLAAALLAVLLVDTLDDADIGIGELLVPPVPDELALLAPPPELAWLGVDLALAASEAYAIPPATGGPVPTTPGANLVVVDHYPRHLSTGVGPEEDIRFRLSAEILADSLDPGDLVLVDHAGRQVVSGVYSPDGRTCILDPLRPLEPGRTFTVTLRGEGLRTPDGGAMAEDYWWYFTTAFSEEPASAY